MRLQVKVALLVAGVTFALGLSSFLVAERVLHRSLSQELWARATLLSLMLARQISEPVLQGEAVPVYEALQGAVRQTPDVAYAYVVGFRNEIFAHSFEGGFPRAFLPAAPRLIAAAFPELSEYATQGGAILDVGYPLIEGMPGHVHVGLYERRAEKEASRLRSLLFFVFAGLAALGIGIGGLVSRRVVRPLARLAESMRRFGEGSSEGKLTVTSGGQEVAELARVFEQMAAGRQATEVQLASEKERLAVTLRSIGDGVIATDAEGRVVLVNRVGEELTGWPQEEAEGRPLSEVFHIVNERTRQVCENPVEKVLNTGWVVGLANHTALLARDGTERSIADSAAPIRDRESKTIGVVLVFRDVTQEKKLEQELLRAEKLQSVGVLAAGIAHDFNNILTAVLASVSLAKIRTATQADVSSLLDGIERASERARDLTQQLLTFSKGGAPIKKAAALPEIIRDSATFALQGSKARLALTVPDDLWIAEVDAGQLSQVIQNLAINADQAMADGGTVAISCNNVAVSGEEALPLPDGRYVRIAVADQGVGIPAENLTRIFDPFFTTKNQGSGLGLTTAYSIIANHGGHIALESKTGVGTTFRVYLPATQKAPEENSADRESAPPVTGRVLLMDDEEIVRDAGGGLLEALGYEVSLASDGEEAIAKYEEALRNDRRFLAVILDLTVPGGMGGTEAFRRLRAMDPGVVAIVSSGYSNDPVMAEHAKHGFRGVAPKPYNMKDLADALRRAVV